MSIRVAGRGFARPLIDTIYDVTLSGTGRFDVTGIPTSYNRLHGTLFCRSDVAAAFDFINIFFNGDTTAANYRRGSHEAGTSHVSSVADDTIFGECTAASSPANYFSNLEFDIPLYAGTHEKFVTSFSYTRRDATIMVLFQFLVQWENAAAINQITFQPDGYAVDEFVAGSQLIIEGHRG